MGLTLAALVSEVYPNQKITLFERLDACGEESSKGINNAGTGHAGYCELNYTPENSRNLIQINRAIQINSMFETSLEFWSYLHKKYNFFNVKKFLKKTPHISFVWGKKDTLFLRGDKSEYISDQDGPLIKHQFPTAVVKTISNAGHWLHAENPVEFFHNVRVFIT